MAYGKVPIMTHTSESGAVQRHMDTGCILGPMEIGTKDNGKCA